MYIDPNTGGMLFQVLATILAVFSGLALLLSGKIRAFTARLKRTLRGSEAEKESLPIADQSVSEATEKSQEL